MTRLRQDAIELLEQMPEDKLIFMIQIMKGVRGLYKDENQEAKDLAYPSFPPLAARALRDGGLLRLATDWEDYASQMRDVMTDAEDFAPAFDAAPDGWAPRFDGRVMTAFERKGLAKGRDIRDLVYRRRDRAEAPAVPVTADDAARP